MRRTDTIRLAADLIEKEWSGIGCVRPTPRLIGPPTSQSKINETTDMAVPSGRLVGPALEDQP